MVQLVQSSLLSMRIFVTTTCNLKICCWVDIVLTTQPQHTLKPTPTATTGMTTVLQTTVCMFFEVVSLICYAKLNSVCIITYMHLSMYCPRYHPMGKGWGFDLYYYYYEINCLTPWSKFYDQMPPIGTAYVTLLSVNFDQIPLIWGMFNLLVK